MSKDFDALALFWGRVLSPVLFKPPDDDRSDRQILLPLSEEIFLHPDGDYRKFSFPTLKRKVKAFRENGIEGLKPAPRSDEGSIRKGRNKTLERAIEIKRANPFRSCFMINLMLEDEGLDPIPESTLQRHFSKRGITVRKLGYEGAIVRKRWTRDHTHSLWVGDFSQGPDVIDEHGVTRKTWISAFIDVHSRFVVAGIYALGCDMDALIRSLLAAFERHGKPKAIYLDNAKVYRSPILGRGCLGLDIELIHRAPYDPQGGGIIERFFLTLQSQLENEVKGPDKSKTPLGLERLNQLFAAWVDKVYHQRRHSETGQTPVQRYRDGLLHEVIPLRPEDVRGHFYHQVNRTVHRDFCDISIGKRRYRVPVDIRGERVQVRYPLGEPGETVELRDLKGRRVIGQGQFHDRSERYVPDPPPPIKDDVDFGELLMKLKDRPTAGPIDPKPRKQWDLGTFVTRLCELTGDDIGTMSEEDLQVMANAHRNNPSLTVKQLRNVYQRCSPKKLSTLLLELCKEKS